jgi:hypothetical protein
LAVRDGSAGRAERGVRERVACANRLTALECAHVDAAPLERAATEAITAVRDQRLAAREALGGLLAHRTAVDRLIGALRISGQRITTPVPQAAVIAASGVPVEIAVEAALPAVREAGVEGVFGVVAGTQTVRIARVRDAVLIIVPAVPALIGATQTLSHDAGP